MFLARLCDSNSTSCDQIYSCSSSVPIRVTGLGIFVLADAAVAVAAAAAGVCESQVLDRLRSRQLDPRIVAEESYGSELIATAQENLQFSGKPHDQPLLQDPEWLRTTGGVAG